MEHAVVRGIVVYAVVLAVLAGLSAYFLLPRIDTTPEENGVKKELRVIDGDTLELVSGERVRLLCIDAPEKGARGADEAAAYLEQLVTGKELRLERDVDDKDRYGRLLRYVYADTVFVNRALVEAGHARVFRYGNDTRRCDEIASAVR